MPGDLCIAPGFTSLSFLSSDRCDWRDTRGKWLLARNPDRSWWHHHTSTKLFWSQPMAPCMPKNKIKITFSYFLHSVLLPPWCAVRSYPPNLEIRDPFERMATRSAHLNLLDLITLTIWGERYKLWSSLFFILYYHFIALESKPFSR